MQRNEEFIEEVVWLAGRVFFTGTEYNEKFKQRARKDDNLRQRYQLMCFPPAEAYERRYVFIKGEPFSYDAVRIPNSHLIAAAGPQNEQTLKEFVANFVYHPSMQQIDMVALGDVATSRKANYFDFYDYCLEERNIEFDPYQMSVKRISGLSSTNIFGDQISPVNVVKTELVILKYASEQKRIPVTVFSLHDNESLHLAGLPLPGFYSHYKQGGMSEEQIMDDRKEAIWQIFQKSLRVPVVVHCAAGVGRTGHFILMLEILKHYDEIFASGDAKIAALKIHQLLQNMRQVKPALVNTVDQFVSAIRNAHIVRQYALEKGYLISTSYQMGSRPT